MSVDEEEMTPHPQAVDDQGDQVLDLQIRKLGTWTTDLLKRHWTDSEAHRLQVPSHNMLLLVITSGVAYRSRISAAEWPGAIQKH